MLKHLLSIALWLCIVSLFRSPGAIAQSVPSMINYQGRLTDQTGAGAAAGTYVVQFRLWDSPTATATNDLVWAQQQTVTVQANGGFSTILGSSSGSQVSGATPQVNDLSLAFGQTNRYIGVTVTSSNGVAIPAPSEILPRQQMMTSPYAFVAATALNVINGIPPGTVLPFAGSAAPTGFLLCDGSAYNGTNYPGLYAAIGTTWGTGTGVGSSFNVPDFRSRFLLGAGQGIGLTQRSIAGKGGEETHQLSLAEIPAHTHTYAVANQGYSDSHDNPNWASSGHYSVTGNPNTSSAGGSQPHNIMPPFAVVNYIIKY